VAGKENKQLTKVKKERERGRSRSFNELPGTESAARPKGVAFRVEGEEPGDKAASRLSIPAGKQETVVELEDDEDIVTALRIKLAEEKVRKKKWKDRYMKLKEKYEQLERSIKEGPSNPRTSPREADTGNKSPPRENTTNGTIDNLTKVLAGYTDDAELQQEKEMQMLLAQRKNELEEKKKILESKRKELEEKRRESGGGD